MTEDGKKKLHDMIDGIKRPDIVEYLVTFVGLFLEKWD